MAERQRDRVKGRQEITRTSQHTCRCSFGSASEPGNKTSTDALVEVVAFHKGPAVDIDDI